MPFKQGFLVLPNKNARLSIPNRGYLVLSNKNARLTFLDDAKKFGHRKLVLSGERYTKPCQCIIAYTQDCSRWAS